MEEEDAMRTKATLLWVVILVAAAGLHAQDQKPKTADPAKAVPPAISDKAKLAISDARGDLYEAIIAEDQLERQYTQLDRQKQAMQTKLQQAITAAFHEAKVSEDDYTLDPKQFVFVPKPKPPALSPAADKKTGP
jgi:hypothetical protein